eukprot:jgi/Galph1/2390/GphlegSOOS_G1033.1
MIWLKACVYLMISLWFMKKVPQLSHISYFISGIEYPSQTQKFIHEKYLNDSAIDWQEEYFCLAVILTILSPIYWNVTCRYEYYTKRLSKMANSSSISLILFAVSILILSFSREWAFFKAISNQPRLLIQLWWLRLVLELAGYFSLLFGGLISMTAFYQLGIFGTYMGEYFGFMFDKKIESFPFNCFQDPMYFGSTAMHFGHSLLLASPTGLYLSLILGFSYWLAARCFEE